MGTNIGAARSGVVLVVDDHADTRDLYVAVLTQKGFVVHEAADGEEAVAAVLARSPDVVLLDVGLPGGVSGWEVAQRLRANDATRHVGIIVLTGYSDEASKEAARAAGADHFLTKPCSPADLIACVDECLQRNRSS